MFRLVIVVFTLALVLYPLNPGVALLLGFVTSTLTMQNDDRALLGRLSKSLLAWSIVGFGLTVNIVTIWQLVVEYFAATISGIAITLIAANIISKILKVDALLAALIGAGTAICGASAIASVSAATKAPGEKTSMALGVVLILNSVALFLFPFLGHLLMLSPTSFSAWAALAIHDTSSVIGAAMSYDPATVEVATTVKLARALWIAPVTIFFANIFSPSKGLRGFKLPWFIWGYLLAAFISSFIVVPKLTHDVVILAARYGFMLGIFFTGCTVQFKSFKTLGVRPFILGVLLWGLSAVWSLILLISTKYQ